MKNNVIGLVNIDGQFVGITPISNTFEMTAYNGEINIAYFAGKCVE